ncbi:hypothetical protein KBA73_02770 [Patescibacteria group bacterium]|nr:hypothetical protein [Patescibacteria group bacterium]
MSPSTLNKSLIITAGLIITLFLGWLGWYIVSVLRIERATILSLASQNFNCPKEQIKTGLSFQKNEGPKEIPVQGCGKAGTILCREYSASQGFLSEYRTIDIECHFDTKSIHPL